MLWRTRFAVLAFAIRSRLSPSGKAEVVPAPAGLSPRLSRSVDCATSEHSGMGSAAAMSKVDVKIDVVPFIPALSPICRAADQALMFCVALAGLAAAGIAVLRQVM